FSQKELDPDFIVFNSQSRRYHFPARSYMPLRANFIQIDPLAMGNPRRSQGLYLYAMANPIIRIDPTGRFSALAFGQSASAIPPGFGVGLNIVDPNIHGWGLVNVRTVILTPFMVSPLLGATPWLAGVNPPAPPVLDNVLPDAIDAARRLISAAVSDVAKLALGENVPAIASRFKLWFGDPTERARVMWVFEHYYDGME